MSFQLACSLALSQRVADNTLPVEEIREQLMAIRGISPWTVNYALLRGFDWLDRENQ